MRSALEFEGHEVTEAVSAAQTLARVHSERDDVLIMDSTLDGIAAYRLCREIRSKSEIGIIVLDDEGTSATSAKMR